MRFFVPDWLHGGELAAGKAERHWTRLCREVSNGYGEALAERMYRLQYVWEGQDMEAQVGEPDPFGVGVVVGIGAVSSGYILCARVPGDRFGGSLIRIDTHDVRNAEAFET
jgi:hypothetical protein